MAGLSPTREILGNGVTVIAKRTSTTPAVTLLANLRAGSAHDTAAHEGLAHFVSRTIDRGTSRRSAEELAEQLDERGVTLSTSISRHLLSLSCTCMAEDVSHVLGLLAEVITQPSFPPMEVERRRGEIVTLIRQDDDNPAAVAVDTFMQMLYGPAHPYGWRMRGTVESVQGIDRSMLQQCHDARAVPAGLSLAIVGDIDPARAIDEAHSVLGGWNGRAAVEMADAPTHAARGRQCRVVPMMNKSQTDIAYGFATIARTDASYHAYAVMNNLLGQYSLGGRLGDSIRERQGMAYYVFSSLEANLMPGPLVIRAGVSPANVNNTITSIDTELRALIDGGPTEQELAESKQYLIGSMPRALETNMGIATYLQTAEFFGLGLDYDLRMPDLVRAVTREQVHDAARRAIDPAAATVVVAGPFEGSLS